VPIRLRRQRLGQFWEVGMGERPKLPFRLLLKQERRAIPGLSQEGLAERSGLSAREISDLETGRTPRPREYTVLQLAEALSLSGERRGAFFEAAGYGWHAGGQGTTTTELKSRGLGFPASENPLEWLAYIVEALDRRGVGAAQSSVAAWQAQALVEPTWLEWVEQLITLTAGGRLQPTAGRPALAATAGPFLGREHETAELSEFVRRIKGGRGGLALVSGPAGVGKSSLVIRTLEVLDTEIQVQALTLDRNEAGYRGWGRLLAPLWTTLRRTELAPADLIQHAPVLDDVLLVPGKTRASGRHYLGEVADAIAALLIHLAVAKPLIIVVDDAHRGGGSSDHLLVELARRVNAHRVGIIAVVRPDELEQDSPLLNYSSEAGRRSGADVVLPVHVPPLGRQTIRILIETQTGADPPNEIIDEVLRQTGGCPQYIESIAIQPPTDPAARGWVVGKFDAEGWRALESTIASRSKMARGILEAAALSAAGGSVEPDVVAAIADLALGTVEAVLDHERQHGPMLLPHVDGYRFQHDSWIDVLLDLCPREKRRVFHARYLALLQAEEAPDPRRLAEHAIAAGAALVGEDALVVLAAAGADEALADCAFGIAAEWYEAAAKHAVGDTRIGLLINQADALRFAGRWEEARTVLKHAISQARTLKMPRNEATALIHLERLTWSYGLDERDLTQSMRDVVERLPPGDAVPRAQIQASLAMRLSITPRIYKDEQADLARAAARQLPEISDPMIRADVILGMRNGLQDSEPPERLLELDDELLALAIKLRSAYHMGEALSCRIVDILRSARLLELPAALRELRDFAYKSTGPLVSYTHHLFEAMLALARGEFGAASQHTDEAIELSGPWGGSMAGEALMAQTGWRLYEMGQLDGLTGFLSSLPQRDVSSLNGPVWSLAEGIIHAEQNRTDEAIRKLRGVCADSQDFSGLPRGPGRIGILAAGAMVIGHPAVCEALPADESTRIAASLGDLLAAHPDELVVAGWPAVLLGSRHRFIGLALLAAAQSEDAAGHLAQAVEANAEFPVLFTRTKFDLARALMLTPGSYSEGVRQMELVAEKAADLKMANLYRQAAEQLRIRRS
jgi:transcriptional regulator with XRE-family HTH domain